MTFDLARVTMNVNRMVKVLSTKLSAIMQCLSPHEGDYPKGNQKTPGGVFSTFALSAYHTIAMFSVRMVCDQIQL